MNSTPIGTSSDGRPEIRIRDLTKAFGTLIAVDGLNLDIHRGEILGFLGPNGAGKTTSINMICGLSEPTRGEISIAGNRDKKENKLHFGLCPQENIFWPKLTCYEQLTFMAGMYGISRTGAARRAHELLRMMNLEAKSSVLAGKLSGGMKRRLNICLALIHDPEILIFDEPEAGLDPQSRIMVRQFIKSLAKKKTIILTTHNMDEADRLSDRVAIIDQGKLLLADTPANLKKSTGEGDIVEISLDTPDPDLLSNATGSLTKRYARVNAEGNTLKIKSKNLIDNLPDIIGTIREFSLSITGVAMRENTLEDVFIHLTGRKLRQ